jgi:hypothetical protein
VQLLNADLLSALLERSRANDPAIRKLVLSCIAAATEISTHFAFYKYRQQRFVECDNDAQVNLIRLWMKRA